MKISFTRDFRRGHARKQRNPSRAAEPSNVDDAFPVPVERARALSEVNDLRSENERLKKNIELSLKVQSAMQDEIGEISRERDRRNAQIIAIADQCTRAIKGYRDAVNVVARIRKRRRRRHTAPRAYWKKTASGLEK
tara:strand:- start:14667 stop:15077 length:411 start_codon:yes stop_codon:yes gene_type:complete